MPQVILVLYLIDGANKADEDLLEHVFGIRLIADVRHGKA